jgi:nucleotide-binding universal stress UspA family protein
MATGNSCRFYYWETAMKFLKRIVVGHDLRTGGDIALQSALSLAERSKAEIKLVHVIEPHPLYERLSHPVSARGVPNTLAQTAGKKLAGTISESGYLQPQIHYEVCVGKPFVELIVARASWQADLVVVGGPSNSNDNSLGSTSEHVIRKAAVPVLVTKRPLNRHPKTILVPVDFSMGAKRAATEAISLAGCFKARIVFFHVIDLYPFFASSYGDDIYGMIPEISAQDLEPEWESFLETLPLERISWVERTQEGSTAGTIIKAAEVENADLIVMGTHGRTGLNQMLLGNVTEKVARGAGCPVLTIRPDAFQFTLP